MADNTQVALESATQTVTGVVATDDIGGVLYQRVKVVHGADGSATDTSASAPLPVTSAPTLAASANIAGSPVSVGTGAAVTVLASYASRKMATLIPEGDVYMSLGGTASPSNGKLPAYTPYNISGYSGAISMLSVAGTINVNVWEF